jgi:branched-chain amino acid transport system substrate-binding protein
MKSHTILVAIIIILLIASAYYISQQPTGQVTSGEPIKIGFIGPMTGDAAEIGLRTKDAVELAVNEINDGGGINGRRLEVVYEDGRCNSKDAADAANKLVNVDKVQVIIGGVCSGETLAAAPIAEKNKVVLISSCSSAPKITEAGDYIFRVFPSDVFQGAFGAEYAYNNLGVRRAAILYTISEVGSAIKDVFKKRFTELGGTIVAEEGFGQDTSDMRSQLTKIKATNPEFIYALAYTSGASLILKQSKEIGLNAKILDTDAGNDPTIIELAGNAAEGFMITVPEPKVPNFEQKFREKTGKDPLHCSYYAYDIVNIIASAMKNVGNNGEMVKNELYKIKDFDGITGKIAFDSNGDRAAIKYGVKQVIKGKFEAIYPAQSPIKLGFIGPLTGEVAVFGISQQGGVKLAVDEINKEGNINLDVIYEDDQCDKTKSVTALRKLIDVDKVKIIIGPVCSGAVLADAPVAEQNKVILLGFGSAAAISDAGEYIFRPTFSDAHQGEFLATNIVKKFKKAAILYVNNDYGVGLFGGFKDNFIKNGGTIAAEDKYSFEDNDWRTQLTKIKASNPNALILISYGREGGLIAKQARELGINVQIVGTDNFGTNEVVEAGGNAVEGAIFTYPASLDDTNPAVKKFKEDYIRLNEKEPALPYAAALSYDTTKIVAQALADVGNDADRIKSYFYDMPAYNGIGGVIDFDSKGDATKEFVFQIIQDGKFLSYVI